MANIIHIYSHPRRFVYVCVGVYIYVYIYVCMYVCVNVNHNSSVWLDTEDVSSWDRKPTNFTLDMVPNRSAISATYINSGIIMHVY